MMSDLLIGFLVVVVCLLWWHQRGVTVKVQFAMQRYCRKLGLQLLDETVQIYRLRPARDQRGEWVLRRYYRFEFTSTGSQRYSAQVVFLGLLMESIDLPPYLSPSEEDELPAETGLF